MTDVIASPGLGTHSMEVATAEDRPMKLLAVYGSNYGQAQAVLGRITGVLESRGHLVTTFKGDAVPASLAVEDYEGVVIAASIIMGHYQPYVRDFVKRHRAALTDRPSAFVSVNGSSPQSRPEWIAAAQQYVKAFFKETGWLPRWKGAFSGALRYPQYGPVTRWIMKMISRRQGGPTDTSKEYEFTDWQAVDRFAAQLADGFAGAAGAGA